MPPHQLDFDDGDVVLVLRSRKYRVHKAVLSEKSEVFADMFTMAHPTSPSFERPGVEELPVVEMLDEEEPFELFLHALYDHDLDPYIPKLARKTTDLIARTLDLVDKYNVPQTPIGAKFIPFISRDWPDTLAAWDANEAHIQELKLKLEVALEEPQELDEQLPEPASAIRIAFHHMLSEAKSQAIQSYVPAAFYHLSRLPSFADEDDVRLGGGSYWDVDGLRSAKRSLLRHQDMMCLLSGKDALRLTAARIAFVDFLEKANDDETPEAEKTAMKRWWREVGIEKLVGPQEMPDPLGRLKDLIDALKGSSPESGLESGVLRRGTSTEYRERMRAYLVKERQDLWDNLAHDFALYSILN